MKINNALAIALAAFSLGTAYVASPLTKTIEPEYAVDATTQSECQKAIDQIDLNVDLSNILTDMRLPYLGLYNCNFTWTSSNASAVNIKTSLNDNNVVTDIVAYITRGTEDVSVTLTVTGQIGTDKESVATKDFAIVVKKAVGSTATELPLAVDEDFSAYEAGLDISNYYKWQMTSGEDMISQIVDKSNDTNLSNINNMPSEHVLRINSGKQASDICYTRKVNINATNAAAGAYMEGYFLYTGNTNGVQIELCNASGTNICGFGINSGTMTYLSTNGFAVSTSKADAGVWMKFRVWIIPSRGRTALYLYSWDGSAYTEVTPIAGTIHGSSSGVTGNITGLRIRSKAGSKSGATYLANLKIDTLANLPETPSTGIVNPNRAMGIGEISGYEKSVLAFTGTTPAALNPTFVVKNRFNKTETLTKDTDYTISSPVENTTQLDGYAQVTYTYTFTLISTGEKETVTQTVYYDEAADTAKIYGFKASYLKAVTGDATKATITLSGNLVRSDATVYYMIMQAGATAPSAAQIIAGTAITGTADTGHQALSEASFAIATNQLDISKEYDAYVVTNNVNGNSDLYKALSISTVINISTAADFYDMSTNIDTASANFRMINDVDFASYDWAEASAITFTGAFNGQGYKVNNLRINLAASKVGIFQTFRGTFQNVTFNSAYVSGIEDVGVIGGNFYQNAVVNNVTFNDCTVDQEATSTGGGGYFGIVAGRMRRGPVIVSNVSMTDSYVNCPKYCGLMTGGLEAGDSTEPYTFTNVYADGHIYTDGAAVGFIGRNRAIANITDAVIFLTVDNAKKEMAVVAGHDTEGGKLNVNRLIGDLKVKVCTQPTYFNNFIGSYAPTTSSYSAKDVYFIKEDYSELGDNIVPTASTVNVGTSVSMPEDPDASWWEQNTYLRNFDTSLIWGYDATIYRPCLQIRLSSDIVITSDMVIALISQIDTSKILANHYYIYKAEEDIAAMSSVEKAKISQDYLDKLATAKAAYEAAIKDVTSVLTATNGAGSQAA